MLRVVSLLVSLTVAVHAAPAALEARGKQEPEFRGKIPSHTRLDVSTAVLRDLNLRGQYSAAGYCVANNNSPGDEVACTAGNCPLVEAATTRTSIEFQKSVLILRLLCQLSDCNTAL